MNQPHMKAAWAYMAVGTYVSNKIMKVWGDSETGGAITALEAFDGVLGGNVPWGYLGGLLGNATGTAFPGGMGVGPEGGPPGGGGSDEGVLEDVRRKISELLDPLRQALWRTAKGGPSNPADRGNITGEFPINDASKQAYDQLRQRQFHSNDTTPAPEPEAPPESVDDLDP